jgi:4-amino-4-deoxy-L-arabinose transferase-like glycosyltransferase
MATTGLDSQQPALAREHLPAPRRFPVEAVLLLVLVAAGFVVRLWPISQVHYWDETVYLQNAEVICCGRTNYSELSSRPPLLSLIFAAVFKVWHSVYAASIVIALLNALGPLFLYLLGRRLMGRTAAAIAALMLAFLPFFASGDVGNSLLSDSPALTLILICFWMLAKAAPGKAERWFAFAGLTGALAVLMRFASLPTVAVLSLLCLRPHRRIAAVLKFGIGFAAGFAPYLLWSRVRYGGFLSTLLHGWQNVAGSVEPTSYYLQNLPTIFSWLTMAGIALWFIAKSFHFNQTQESADLGSTAPPASRDLLYWELFLWGWVVIVLAYYMAIPHKELRYILPLAPPLLLLAGRGLAQLFRFRNVALRAAAALVLIAAFAYTCAPILARFRSPLLSPYVSEEKEVSDYLKSVAPKSAVLYANFNYPVFAYYTGLTTHVLLDQGDSFYQQFPGNMPEDGYLLVYRELDMNPHLDWVDANPHFHRLTDFPSLVVYQYRARTN